MLDKILILDFGSQYTQLIARKIRELGVYSEVHPFDLPLGEIKKHNPKGIILSGGPSSVYDENAPFCSCEIFDIGIPILGICYGMQLMCHFLGGKVEKSNKREYGETSLSIVSNVNIFKDIPSSINILMSHGDKVVAIPSEFKVLAKTENTTFAGISCAEKNLFALQFHPETNHCEQGINILSNFIFDICGATKNWTISNFISNKIVEIKSTVGDNNVICAISGGVDSSVIATLINKAIGKQLHCIFVNNGLLRNNEVEIVIDLLKNKLGLQINYIDAEERFLSALKDINDPEKKRKIIGYEFIKIFEEEAKKIPNAKFLAQGTLYSDVIESVSIKGPSATIKSHHNVGGLPKDMSFTLLEPARELFKDEVRLLGRDLGLLDEVLYRHPFPGPGLAVRILGDITKEKIEILRKADSILIEEIKKLSIYNDMWQAFAVLLPVKTVGVMGDERTYENVCAIRMVESIDAMTANVYPIDIKDIIRISSRITNEVKGISRVVYDVTSKPPATIEWE